MTTEIEAKKSTEVTPVSSKDGLFSFDEFDNFFDDFLAEMAAFV
ncbi:hypothetical protein RP726_09770 [Candidatus Methylospira mobilis]|nr:hypothetical protein [Candidatus Methylospira mobilis]WNV06673.1 hypothetical protein RP726_09770 [Candidatus Methylospira mobilis]